ncbi:hypothetical protein WMY93_012267 [Mugilogobius chulae]|uniref:Cytochrome P450 n=1 Tax=Mugilogobius chulae TaxID=88201 RepID=A0AAW0PAM4_9GOBI
MYINVLVEKKGVILADYGHKWKEHRRFALTTMRNFGLGKQSMEQRILKELQHTISGLEKNTGKALSAQVMFHNIASNIICLVLFGQRFDYQDEFIKKYVYNFTEVNKIVNGPWTFLYDSFHCIRSLPLPFNDGFKKWQTLKNMTSSLIKEQMETRVPGQPRNFVDCYLDEMDKRAIDGTSFSSEELLFSCLNLHSAGTDTTSNTLLTSFLYLMNNPHIQERCQQEIDRVLEGKDSVTYEDRHSMPYVQAVVHESQRMADTVPLSVFHSTTKDTELMGYSIPKGTIIIPNLSSALSEEGQWKFPHEFNPENFLNQESPRVCLGESLARMELFLILVTLLRRFTFIWPEDSGEPDYELVFGITMTPKPYNMKFRSRRPKNFPPGPIALPFLGNALSLSLDNPLKYFESLRKTYGNVYSLYIGHRAAVVVCGTKALKEALVNKAVDFAGRPQDMYINAIVEEKGFILADYGNKWKEQRRFSLMTLRNFGLGKQSMEQRILTELQYTISDLEKNTGKALSAQVMFHNMASNVICLVLFGKRFDYQDEFIKKYVHRFTEINRLINGPWTFLYDSFHCVRRLPLPFNKGFKTVAKLKNMTSSLIKEQMKTRVPGQPRNFVDCFLDEMDKRADNKHFSSEELLFSCLNLHSAGTDTTSNTLLTSFLYLMNNPHIQERCQQEIDRVLEGRDSVTYEDRHNMPYVQAVVHESQRMADTVPLSVFHATTKDTELMGYSIPKGTIMIPNLSSALSEEGQWKFPHEFNPENFLNREGEFVKPDAFLPFSAGPRVCMGEGLARMELFLILVTLLRKFRFIWPEDAGEPDYELVFGVFHGKGFRGNHSDTKALSTSAEAKFMLEVGLNRLCKHSVLCHSLDMFVSVLLLLICFCFFVIHVRFRRPKNFPPGPTPLPLLGNVLYLCSDNPLADLEKLRRTYGNVYSIYIGHRAAVVVNGTQALKETLIHKGVDFAGRPQDLFVNDFTDRRGVLLTDYGPAVKEHRRFALTTLRNFGLGKQSMEQRILGELQYTIDHVKQNVGKILSPQTIFHTVASNVICQVLFNKRYEHDDEFIITLVSSFCEVTKMANGPWAFLYDCFSWVRQLPLPFVKAFEAMDKVKQITIPIINEHKKTRVKGEPRDFVDCYLDELDKSGNNSSFSPDDLMMFCFILHIAGTDSTADSLLCLFLYLVTKPHIQERCQQEIDRVLEGKDIVTFEDRHDMPYVQAVLHEAQRIANTVPLGLFHKTLRDTELMGYSLPKGTMVIANLSSALNEDGQWKFPHEFNPENFLNQKGDFVKPDAFMPFSAGPRICPGESLARMELFLISVTLLRKFRFIWPEDAGEPDYTPVFGITMMPRPYNMVVEIR